MRRARGDSAALSFSGWRGRRTSRPHLLVQSIPNRLFSDSIIIQKLSTGPKLWGEPYGRAGYRYRGTSELPSTAR